MDTLNELAELERKNTEELKEKILQVIDEWPDNPNVTRLSKNVFTVSSANLGSSWAPTHHDHRLQAELLKQVIDGAGSIAAIRSRFAKIFTDEAIQSQAHGKVILGRPVLRRLERLIFGRNIRYDAAEIIGGEFTLAVRQLWSDFKTSITEPQFMVYFTEGLGPSTEGHIAFDRYLAERFELAMPTLEEETIAALKLNKRKPEHWDVSFTKDENDCVRICWTQKV